LATSHRSVKLPAFSPTLHDSYERTQIALRILPNDEDFSQYYVDPYAHDPVRQRQTHVRCRFREGVADVLPALPVMNGFIALNEESRCRTPQRNHRPNNPALG